MQNKSGIAFVTTAFYPIIGGAEVQSRNLAVFLSRKGYALTVYTYPVEGAPSSENIDGIEVLRPRIINKGKFAPFSFLLATGFRLLKNRKRYSIIQGHQLPMGIIAGIMGKLLSWKSLVKIEGMDEILRYRNSMIKSFILRNFIDKFISLGNSATRELKALGIPAAKIIYIPNAFDSDCFNYVKPRVEDAEKHVVFVGRLEYEKAPEVLIKAWTDVVRRHPEARLVMLGDGGKRAELRDMIAQLGLSHSIEMRGAVSNVADYLQSASVFVLPSRIEGVPIAMLEAMAMGVPVIVTPVGDIPGIIKDGENGIFVRPDDVEGLADAISDLLSSQEKRQALSKKARISVQDFSMDKVGRQYIELYEELLNER